MAGAAPCELPAFGQVLLGPGEIVLRSRSKEVLLQSSDASIEVVSGQGLSVRAVANSFQTTLRSISVPILERRMRRPESRPLVATAAAGSGRVSS